MDFKVIFQNTFLEDLEGLVGPIAQNNPTAAARIGDKIITKAESLRYFPERYPRLRKRPTIRRFIIQRNIKVFYRVDAEAKAVLILRCWDGRRGDDPNLTV
jgi:plasmid stabilization system protein ParE